MGTGWKEGGGGGDADEVWAATTVIAAIARGNYDTCLSDFPGNALSYF